MRLVQLARALCGVVGVAAAVVGILISTVSAETAQEIMDKVIKNLKGPDSQALVGHGYLSYSRKRLELNLVHGVSNGAESMHVDFLSPTDEMDGTTRVGKKYRVIRREEMVPTSLLYLPSLQRGRNRPYVPLDQILGSEYLYYFLSEVSNLTHDFSYILQKEDEENPIIEGVRIGSVSPFLRATWFLQRHGNTYLIREVRYFPQVDDPIIQTFQGYVELPGAPYWMPSEIRIGKTVLAFDKWMVQSPPEWLFSPNHASMGTNQIVSLFQEN